MLPILIGIGLFALLADEFMSDEPRPKRKAPRKKRKIFISFAVQDSQFRDFLVGQSRNENSPFEFMDMSVKQPWTEAIWKRKCREKIRQCDGMIILLSNNTWHASGVRWEIKCAREEGVKIVGMHIRKNEKRAIPPELAGKKIIEWNWDKLENFVNQL